MYLLLLNSIFWIDLGGKKGGFEDPALYEFLKNTSRHPKVHGHIWVTLYIHIWGVCTFVPREEHRLRIQSWREYFDVRVDPVTRMGNVSRWEEGYFILFSIHFHDNKKKIWMVRRVKQVAREITDANFHSKNYREVRCEDNTVDLTV